MSEPAWVEHVIWWQVYPLGFVGAYPAEVPPSADEHRLRRVAEWFEHAIELGASGVALPRLRHHRPLPDRPATR
jgi:cyclomaltodextrinase / maltogenic alpha-amylase / neopullulanase